MVKTKEVDGKLHVFAEYNTEFVKKAKSRVRGRWVPDVKAWEFPMDQREDVLEILRECYGEDGETPVQRVSVRVRIGEGGLSQQVKILSAALLGDRFLARRDFRDGPVRLGPDVSLVEGPDFSDASGSMKNPTVGGDGTLRILLVKNVPLVLAEKAALDDPGTYSVVSTENQRHKALLEEKTRLLERLNEIDKLLDNVS